MEVKYSVCWINDLFLSIDLYLGNSSSQGAKI